MRGWGRGTVGGKVDSLWKSAGYSYFTFEVNSNPRPLVRLHPLLTFPTLKAWASESS